MFSNPKDEQIKDLLQKVKNIAVVGLSPKQERPSNGVANYLKSQGYNIIPVNPGHSEILGEKSFPDLKSIPVEVDIVDVFRKPDTVMPIVEEALEINPKAIWFQEGVINEEAAQKAQDGGLMVVMDRCMLKEYKKLIES
ncbi:MAG: CoA-binding protein [candidate division Zixibacteria bacterium]|nr:CoA-binding protein [candidate division Zixibacteria bacterium]